MMLPASTNPFVMWPCCSDMAEWIGFLLGLRTLGRPGDITLDSGDEDSM